MKNKYVSIADIAACDEKEDLVLWRCQFLDDFKRAEDKYALIADEPVWTRSYPEWLYYDLAAAAHKLANDNNLPIPKWVLDKKYISPRPIYAFNTENKEFQKFLRKTSLKEYVDRNLFFGDNTLDRA